MGRLIYFILFLSFIFLQCKKDNSTSLNTANSQAYDHNLPPGYAAGDFLRNTTYKSLIIEIQYMSGCEIRNASLTMLIDFLKERLNKTDGIFVQLKQIDPTLKTLFSISDISAIESMNRTFYTGRDQMAAYVIILNGSYAEGNVLALSYKNTSVCLFAEPIKYFSPGVTDNVQAKVIAMLLEHEFGHLLGLVDMGTPMVLGHNDSQFSNHCENSECLMHHTFETYTRLLSRALGTFPSLDMNCLADLRENGGK